MVEEGYVLPKPNACYEVSTSRGATQTGVASPWDNVVTCLMQVLTDVGTTKRSDPEPHMEIKHGE